MEPWILLGFIVWIYVLSLFKRAEILSMYFIFGSIGLFFLIIALSKPYIIWLLTQAVIKGVDSVTSLAYMSHAYPKYGLIYISNPVTPTMMSIDYECSGIIESAAFIGMVSFFPIFGKNEKLFCSLFGILYIYLSNVIRIFIVVTFVHFGGGDLFMIAHSVIGRLFFYAAVIALYYNVFTVSHFSKSIHSKLNPLSRKFKRSKEI